MNLLSIPIVMLSFIIHHGVRANMDDPFTRQELLLLAIALELAFVLLAEIGALDDADILAFVTAALVMLYGIIAFLLIIPGIVFGALRRVLDEGLFG
jgi:hypothetical protein